MALTKVTYSMILGEVANVLDFGAKGDGTTDDTVAIQAAITASQNVYFPAGIYKVTAPINLDVGAFGTTRPIRLYGDGYDNYEETGSIISGTHAGNIFQYADIYSGMIVEMLEFRGAGCSALRQTDLTKYSAFLKIRDCSFNANLAECIYGNIILSEITSCFFGFKGTAATAHRHIYSKGAVGAESNANTITKCVFNNALGSESIFWELGDRLVIQDCDFEANNAYIFRFRGLYASEFRGNWIEGSDVVPYFGIYEQDTGATSDCYINTVDNCLFSVGVSSTITHFFDLNSTSSSINFTNNHTQIANSAKLTRMAGNDDTKLNLFFNNRSGYYTSTVPIGTQKVDALLVGKTASGQNLPVTANGAVLQVSDGVTFQSIQISLGNPNTLDDYEEGVWTVTLFDAPTGGNASSTTVAGQYTKIGNKVTCTFSNLNSINTSGMTSGNTFYVSLPFVAGFSSSGSIVLSGATFPAGTTSVSAYIDDNLGRMRIAGSGTGTSVSAFTVGNISGNSISRAEFVYFV